MRKRSVISGRFLILMIGCALAVGGCRGGLRDPTSRVRRPVTAADQLSDRRIELVLSDYGERLVGMHDRDWRNTILYSRGVALEIDWLCHFGPILELDAEAGNGAGTVSMSHREVQAAMVGYITEKIYPVSMSLSIMRGGRRFLLGDHIDSYIRDLELRRSGGGLELIYKKDF